MLHTSKVLNAPKRKEPWTDAEKLTLTRRCIQKLSELRGESPEQSATLQPQQVSGLLKKVVVPVMQELFANNPSKIRLLHQHSSIPWLPWCWNQVRIELTLGSTTKHDMEPVAEVVDTQTHTPPTPLPVVNQPLIVSMTGHFDMTALATALAPLIAAEVVKLLVKNGDVLTALRDSAYEDTSDSMSLVHRALSRRKLREAEIESTVPAANKKPVVLVYGLLNDQASAVETQWGHKFEMRFKGSQKNSKLLPEQLSGCNYAIGVTSFMSHAKDAALYKHFKKNYVRMTGGVSSVNACLNKLWARVNLPTPLAK